MNSTEFGSRLNPEVRALHFQFDELKERLGSYYECREDLDSLQLYVEEDSKFIYPACEGGVMFVGRRQLDSLRSDMGMLDHDLDDDMIARTYIGIGIAGVVASTLLSRFARDGKHFRYADALRDFFCSHTPVEKVFSEIFSSEDLQGRAKMTEVLSDHQATVINGLRYQFKLFSDAFSESEDYSTIPSRSRLAVCAKEHILAAYMKESAVFIDAMVVGLSQSPEAGDKLFFSTLPEWLIALAIPLQDSELTVLQSDAWNS